MTQEKSQNKKKTALLQREKEKENFRKITKVAVGYLKTTANKTGDAQVLV